MANGRKRERTGRTYLAHRKPAHGNPSATLVRQIIDKGHERAVWPPPLRIVGRRAFCGARPRGRRLSDAIEGGAAILAGQQSASWITSDQITPAESSGVRSRTAWHQHMADGPELRSFGKGRASLRLDGSLRSRRPGKVVKANAVAILIDHPYSPIRRGRGAGTAQEKIGPNPPRRLIGLPAGQGRICGSVAGRSRNCSQYYVNLLKKWAGRHRASRSGLRAKGR